MAEDNDDHELERKSGSTLPQTPLHGVVLSANHWNPSNVPYYKRPIVVTGAFGGFCLSSVIAYLISEFLQMRGVVNIIASRVCLIAAAGLVIAFICVVVYNIRIGKAKKMLVGAVFSALIIFVAYEIDKGTLPAPETDGNKDGRPKIQKTGTGAPSTLPPDTKSSSEPKPIPHPRRVMPTPAATSSVTPAPVTQVCVENADNPYRCKSNLDLGNWLKNDSAILSRPIEEIRKIRRQREKDRLTESSEDSRARDWWLSVKQSEFADNLTQYWLDGIAKRRTEALYRLQTAGENIDEQTY